MSATTSLKYRLTALIIILALSSLANPVFASEINKNRNRLNDVNSQLNQTRQKITQAKAQEYQLVSQIQQMDSNIASVQKEYDRLDDELKTVSSQRATTEKQLADLQAQLYQTQQDLDNTDAKLTEQKGILDNRIQNIYKRGDTGYIDVILNSSDFVNLLKRMRFLEFIVSQDVDIVERISKTKAAIEEKKLEVEQDKAAVNSARIKLIDEERKTKQLTDAKLVQKTALQAEIGKKQSLLSQTQSNRAACEIAEKQLLAESNSIAARIRQLEKGGSLSQITYNPSGFAWPTSGRVTSPYGYRICPFHGRELHSGIDIGAPSGQAVVAAQDGVVIEARYSSSYGNMVIISHGGGVTSLYAHQSAILVSNGQRVSKGQTIGRVGSTGYSTGPHLHFEIRKNGTPQNPMNWY